MGRTHDFQLRDRSSSAENIVNLVCLRDTETKLKRIVEGRLKVLPERISLGAVGYDQFVPGANLSFAQEDFSGGALVALQEPEKGTQNKYAFADGCDLRWSNIATLGMQREGPIDFIVRNPGAELGTTAGWTAGTGVTLTAVAGAAQRGSFGFRIVTDGNRSGNDVLMSQNFANPGQWDGVRLEAFAYIRRVSGSGGAMLEIFEDVPLGSPSSPVTSSSFVQESVYKTFHSPFSTIGIGLSIASSESAPNTFEVDVFFVQPKDGDGGGVTCGGVAELAGEFYGIFGPWICRWDETVEHGLSYSVWDLVFEGDPDDGPYTSIVEYDGNIFAARGNGDNAYHYGSGVSWTTSNLAGDAKYAHFFEVSRGTLWKSRFDAGGDHNFLASSTNAINGGSWAAETTIGSSDRHITGIHDINDTILVGKEDGAYLYNRVANDFAAAATFKNITNEYRVYVDSENFQRGTEFHGNLFLTAAQQSFFFFDGLNFNDISGMLFAPRLTDFGGRVRAMAVDPVQLWMLLDTPTTDTATTKDTWLMSIRLNGAGDFLVHTIEKVRIGDINILAANNESGTPYLWAFGRLFNADASTYEASIFRWFLPEKTVAPALDDTPAINTGGKFRQSTVSFGMPDQDKAFHSVTIHYENNLDAEHTIIVAFSLDGSSSFTTLGTANGSGTSSTFFFNDIGTPEDNAVGRSIQIQVTMATDDTVSPRLYAMVIRANYEPDPVKTREVFFYVGENRNMLTGQTDETITVGAAGGQVPSKANILTAIENMEAQAYPIQLLEDFDDDNSLSTTRVRILRDSIRRVPDSERDAKSEVWAMTLQEVAVS